jgi:hypothetical protein
MSVLESLREMLIIVLVTLALYSGAEAQPVAAEDLRSRAKSGDTVHVTDASARETSGTLIQFANGALTMRVEGEARTIPFDDIGHIKKRGDSVMNGFLIGAAVGGAMGAAIGALQSSNCSECGEDQFPLGPVMVVAALELGGIGALIDYFIKGRTLIYRAGPRAGIQVVPIMFDQHRGVRLSLTF